MVVSINVDLPECNVCVQKPYPRRYKEHNEHLIKLLSSKAFYSIYNLLHVEYGNTFYYVLNSGTFLQCACEFKPVLPFKLQKILLRQLVNCIFKGFYTYCVYCDKMDLTFQLMKTINLRISSEMHIFRSKLVKQMRICNFKELFNGRHGWGKRIWNIKGIKKNLKF